MGTFILQGQACEWAGYASVSSPTHPDDDIRLPPCFNLPKDDYINIIERYDDSLEIERILKDFFERI